MLPFWLLVACAPSTAEDSFTDAVLEGELEGYEDWAHPADWPGVSPSCFQSHGAYVQIWLNAVAAADLEGEGPFSEGALLVHESYQDPGSTPKMFTAMRKVTGFAPAGGDWYWAQYDENHALVDSGQLDTCAACHASGFDFVRHVGTVPPPSPGDCEATSR